MQNRGEIRVGLAESRSPVSVAINTVSEQMQAAVKALHQAWPCVLMADGVRLGKKIDFGIRLTELIERGDSSVLT